MKRFAYTLYFSLIIVGLAISSCKNKDQITAVEETQTQVEEMKGDSAVVGEVKEVQEKVAREVLYFEQTACFGTCPSFTFSAMSDGSCSYTGRNFVDRIGQYKGTIDPSAYAEVYMVANKLNYDTLQTTYDNPMVTDLPASITTIKGKKVTNRYQGPDLGMLYDALDSLVEKVAWEKVKNSNY